MFKVEIYEGEKGNSELKDWLRELKHRKDRGNKDARIILNQIHYCIERLKFEETFTSIEIVKHISDDIWELRPDRYRVMFFQVKDGKIVLLHHFWKETQRTPIREINKAFQLRNDWIRRNQ